MDHNLSHNVCKRRLSRLWVVRPILDSTSNNANTTPWMTTTLPLIPTPPTTSSALSSSTNRCCCLLKSERIQNPKPHYGTSIQSDNDLILNHEQGHQRHPPLSPDEITYILIHFVHDAWSVIRSMQIRGAPLITIVAILGLAVDLTSNEDTMKQLDGLSFVEDIKAVIN